MCHHAQNRSFKYSTLADPENWMVENLESDVAIPAVVATTEVASSLLAGPAPLLPAVSLQTTVTGRV